MKRLNRILYFGIGLAFACAIRIPRCFIPSSLFLLTQITNIRATPSLSPSLKRCHWRKKSLHAPWEQKLSVHPLKPSLNRNIPANPDAHEFGTGHEIIETIVNTPSTSSHPSSGRVDAFFAGAGTGGTISQKRSCDA